MVPFFISWRNNLPIALENWESLLNEDLYAPKQGVFQERRLLFFRLRQLQPAGMEIVFVDFAVAAPFDGDFEHPLGFFRL